MNQSAARQFGSTKDAPALCIRCIMLPKIESDFRIDALAAPIEAVNQAKN